MMVPMKALNENVKELMKHIGLPKTYEWKMEVLGSPYTPDVIFRLFSIKDIQIPFQKFNTAQESSRALLDLFWDIEKDFKECDMFKKFLEIETDKYVDRIKELEENNKKMEERIKELTPYENYFKLEKELRGIDSEDSLTKKDVDKTE